MLVTGAVGDDPTDITQFINFCNTGVDFVNVVAPGVGIISTYIDSGAPEYPKPEDFYWGERTGSRTWRTRLACMPRASPHAACARRVARGAPACLAMHNALNAAGWLTRVLLLLCR